MTSSSSVNPDRKPTSNVCRLFSAAALVQWLAAGDAVQLERTKQLLPRLSYVGSAAANGISSGKEDEQPIAQLVIDAVERHAIGQLSDFTAAFPQGTSRMRGLIDAMHVAVQCRSPGEGITRVLPLCRLCVRASYAWEAAACHACNAPMQPHQSIKAYGSTTPPQRVKCSASVCQR